MSAAPNYKKKLVAFIERARSGGFTESELRAALVEVLEEVDERIKAVCEFAERSSRINRDAAGGRVQRWWEQELMAEKYLLVGGSHDGERAEATLYDEVIRKVDLYASVEPVGPVTAYGPEPRAPSQVVFEDYTRRVFFSDRVHWHILFAINTLTDKDVADRLLAWYRPVEPDDRLRRRLLVETGCNTIATGAELDAAAGQLVRRRGL